MNSDRTKYPLSGFQGSGGGLVQIVVTVLSKEADDQNVGLGAVRCPAQPWGGLVKVHL
ncbi:MAG TPA: hypothetical protein PLD30_07555 [Candidatus Competibacteraceae bacterium]|nr:hypothetical protein [Candidatus Competibacteraceae bacterium]